MRPRGRLDEGPALAGVAGEQLAGGQRRVEEEALPALDPGRPQPLEHLRRLDVLGDDPEVEALREVGHRQHDLVGLGGLGDATGQRAVDLENRDDAAHREVGHGAQGRVAGAEVVHREGHPVVPVDLADRLVVLEQRLLGELEDEHQPQPLLAKPRDRGRHHRAELGGTQREGRHVHEEPRRRPGELAGALPHSPQDVAVEGGGLAEAVDVVDELPRRQEAPGGADAGEGLHVREAAGPEVHDGLVVDLDPPVSECFGHPGEALVVVAEARERLLGLRGVEEEDTLVRAPRQQAGLVEGPQELVGRVEGRGPELHRGDERPQVHEAHAGRQGHAGEDVATAPGQRLDLRASGRPVQDEHVGAVGPHGPRAGAGLRDDGRHHRAHDLGREVAEGGAVELVEDGDVPGAEGRDEGGRAVRPRRRRAEAGPRGRRPGRRPGPRAGRGSRGPRGRPRPPRSGAEAGSSSSPCPRSRRRAL